MRSLGLNARMLVVALVVTVPVVLTLLLLTMIGEDVHTATDRAQSSGQTEQAANALERAIVDVQDTIQRLSLVRDEPPLEALRRRFAGLEDLAAANTQASLRAADRDAHRAHVVRLVGLIVVPLLAILGALLVSRLITRPLRQIGDEADQISKAMLEAVADGYVAVDEDGVVLAFTPQAERIFGYTQAEMLGRVFADVAFPPEARAAHHARRRQLLDADGRLAPYRITITRRDGHQVQIEIAGTIVRTESRRMAAYFVRDVTDEILREEEQKAKEAVGLALVRAGPDDDLLLAIIAAMGESLGSRQGSFWELDERDRTIRCTRIWNAPDFAVPVIDQLLRDVRYDLDRPADPNEPVIVAWRTREVQWVRLRLTRPELRPSADTPELHIALLVPVIVGGEVMGLFGVGTTSAEPPDELRWSTLRSIADLVGQVVSRRRAEREADRLKNEFFALVSHELRTPLTSLIGYLEILHEEGVGPLNEEQERYLGVMDRSARRLLRLVGDLLFVAQVEAGNLSLDRGPADLRQVALDAIEAAAPRAQQGGVMLIADAAPVRVSAVDIDRLGQLVDNLVSNAIKFTPAGGTVNVTVRQDGETAVLEVRDSGPGISAEDQRQLFERFFRTEAARTNAVPGIGLGLSIARAIAEGHGGTLEVESAPGEGATFRVSLPI